MNLKLGKNKLIFKNLSDTNLNYENRYYREDVFRENNSL